MPVERNIIANTDCNPQCLKPPGVTLIRSPHFSTHGICRALFSFENGHAMKKLEDDWCDHLMY